MKSAFTMIELIFVIVILGILSAAVIPRFSATRDDSQVSKFAQNIGTSIEEIAGYANAKGSTDKDFAVMSHAMARMKQSGETTLSENKAVIAIGAVNCVNIEVIKSATNDDLKVSFVSSTDAKCLNLQSTVDAQSYSMKLRGTSVTY